MLDLRADHKPEHLRAALSLARSTYHYHRALIEHPAQDKYAQVKAAITEVFTDARGRYGHRRIHAALTARGFTIAKKTVLALMNELGLLCKVRRARKYCSYRQTSNPVFPNVLNREFTADAPGRKWVTDVTEFRVRDRKLYLSPVMDLFNREVLAYSLSEHPTVAFAKAALTDALATLPAGAGSELLVHSDQGLQYRHRTWNRELTKVGATQSMSRKGNCHDNAVMENFFGHLKAEAFHHEQFTSTDQLTTTIADYIGWYNTERISTTLNNLSPIAYRQQASTAPIP